MVVTCSNCSTRLQLDDTKVPTRQFTVRCPKCHASVSVHPVNNAMDHSALSVGETPALDNPRYHHPSPAPAFVLEPTLGEHAAEAELPLDSADAARVLAGLLRAGGTSPFKSIGSERPAWETRRTLVCVAPGFREAIARSLAKAHFQVFVAENTSQALESLRDEHISVLILDPAFDSAEQGAAFVTSEVTAMRPADRRQLFVAHLLPTLRSLDAQQAFINNVQLIINSADCEGIAAVLDRGLRTYNELYREFFDATGVNPI